MFNSLRRLRKRVYLESAQNESSAAELSEEARRKASEKLKEAVVLNETQPSELDAATLRKHIQVCFMRWKIVRRDFPVHNSLEPVVLRGNMGCAAAMYEICAFVLDDCLREYTLRFGRLGPPYFAKQLIFKDDNAFLFQSFESLNEVVAVWNSACDAFEETFRNIGYFYVHQGVVIMKEHVFKAKMIFGALKALQNNPGRTLIVRDISLRAEKEEKLLKAEEYKWYWYEYERLKSDVSHHSYGYNRLSKPETVGRATSNTSKIPSARSLLERNVLKKSQAPSVSERPGIPTRSSSTVSYVKRPKMPGKSRSSFSRFLSGMLHKKQDAAALKAKGITISAPFIHQNPASVVSLPNPSRPVLVGSVAERLSSRAITFNDELPRTNAAPSERQAIRRLHTDSVVLSAAQSGTPLLLTESRIASPPSTTLFLDRNNVDPTGSMSRTATADTERQNPFNSRMYSQIGMMHHIEENSRIIAEQEESQMQKAKAFDKHSVWTDCIAERSIEHSLLEDRYSQPIQPLRISPRLASPVAPRPVAAVRPAILTPREELSRTPSMVREYRRDNGFSSYHPLYPNAEPSRLEDSAEYFSTPGPSDPHRYDRLRAAGRDPHPFYQEGPRGTPAPLYGSPSHYDSRLQRTTNISLAPERSDSAATVRNQRVMQENPQPSNLASINPASPERADSTATVRGSSSNQPGQPYLAPVPPPFHRTYRATSTSSSIYSQPRPSDRDLLSPIPTYQPTPSESQSELARLYSAYLTRRASTASTSESMSRSESMVSLSSATAAWFDKVEQRVNRHRSGERLELDVGSVQSQIKHEGKGKGRA